MGIKKPWKEVSQPEPFGKGSIRRPHALTMSGLPPDADKIEFSSPNQMLHLGQHSAMSVFLVTVILLGMKWWLIVVLICIFF